MSNYYKNCPIIVWFVYLLIFWILSCTFWKMPLLKVLSFNIHLFIHFFSFLSYDYLSVFPLTVKTFLNQKLPSDWIFVFRENMKFLFTLQPRRFGYTLLQKNLNFIIFLHVDSILAKIFTMITPCPLTVWELPKFPLIPSEKIIGNLMCINKYSRFFDFVY